MHPNGWETAEKGFWRKGASLTLTESICCGEKRVTLSQHVIIDESGAAAVYRFWIHTFSHTDLEGLLTAQDFRTAECYDRIIPGCDMYSSKDVTFCISTK